ncbi:MAG: DUF1566 domain-containing protein, partial [Myxococcaceae bacterium]|nr:DUF1566 domain-containing protein [Myxococcaceae bacterium]
AWLNQSQVTNAVANQALTQLVSNQTLPAAQQKQLFSTGLKALFAELTPAIQAMPDYTGQFVANCSIFMNTHIEHVLCEINSTTALGRPESCGQSSLLPLEYEHQITESAILLVSFYADWTGKTSLSSQSYAVRLFDRMPTCTVSASVSQTKPTLSQTLSKASSRNTLSLLGTLSHSFAQSLSPSQKHTPTLSDAESVTGSSSRTLSASQTASISVSQAPTRSQTLSKASSRNTLSLLGTLSHSFTESLSLSRKYTPTLSDAESISGSSSRTLSASQTLSSTQSFSPTLSPSALVVWNPEWANWQVTTGVYRDNANQTGRYLESVPGVITDRMTGLQWQKVGSAPAGNWTASKAYCANLFEFGLGDWRLPTHVELQTLVDYTMNCAGPSMDLDFFPGTQSSYYWSSDALQGYSESAWWVSYGNGAGYAGLVCSQGYSSCSSVPASGFTRCVRPLSAVREVDRYTFNSTQVLDTVTGLIWQRTVSGTYNWGGAQAYCTGLNLDGLSWRLPNIKELSTLLDVHVAYPGPTINSTAFPSTPQGTFWTSTRYSCVSPSYAWSVYFDFGLVGSDSVGDARFVRCVR